MKNIVYIVAHPDDESLLVGGTISALNKSEHYNIYVLCLWGLLEAPDEHREESFYKATADCKKSIFLSEEASRVITQLKMA